VLGCPLCSPFDLLPNEWKNFGLKASVLPAQLGKTVEVLGYYITCKPTRTSKGDRMYFGNFIDAEGDFIDTAHFPVVGKDNMGWRGSGIYQIQGRVIEEMGVYNIEVEAMRKLSYDDDPRYADLRTGEKNRKGKKH
jgi:DNA polymerase-3 subunit alpha